MAHCVDQGIHLEEMSLADLQGFNQAIEEDVFSVLSLEGSVAARNHVGGTAPNRVAAAAQSAMALLDQR